jgi:hypothetical protein
VAARVLAQAGERAQGDHVVVRRALAVDAIGQEVLGEVAVELGDGEGEQLGVLEREADHRERVQLERAVVALGRERLADVPGLDGDPLRQCELVADRADALPRVDPVDDPAAGDLTRVGVMFHHAAMDDDEMDRAGELLELVAGHERTDARPMMSLV